MRIKVQTLKTLLWLGNALAFAAILSLLVYIFMQIVPIIKDTNKARARTVDGLIKKALGVSATIKARERSSGMSWSEYDNLRNLNVTGRDPPPPPDKDVAKTDLAPVLKKIEDVIAIKQVVGFSNDPTRGAVSIRYKEDPDPAPAAPPPAPADPSKPATRSPVRLLEGFLEVGSSLRPPYDKPPFNGQVLNIFDYGVEFAWGDGKVVVLPNEMPRDMKDPALQPGLGDPPTESSNIDPDQAAKLAAAAKESRALNDNDWYIGTDELARFDSEGEALLGEVELGIMNVKSEGRPRLALKKVPEDSLAYKRGFREGDVLRTINGEEMSGKSSVVDYFKNNKQQSSYKIEIERLGSRVTKSFRVAR